MDKEKIKKAVQFSNFAQRVKMKYWKGEHPIEQFVAEDDLDEILLLAFDELQAQKDEILRGLPKERIRKDFRGTFPGTEENIGFNKCLRKVRDLINKI